VSDPKLRMATRHSKGISRLDVLTTRVRESLGGGRGRVSQNSNDGYAAERDHLADAL